MGRSPVPVATLQMAPKGAPRWALRMAFRRLPDPNDLATVRAFNFARKIAYDEMHDDPFDP